MHCAKNDLPLQWFGRIHWQSQQRWTAKLRELHGDPKLSRLLQSLGSRLKARVARDSGDSQPPNRPKNTWPCHFGFRMCKVRLKALSKPFRQHCFPLEFHLLSIAPALAAILGTRAKLRSTAC